MDTKRREPLGRQPIDGVEWVEASELFPNDYNPNTVYRPELELLALSILRSGWTQPIVARASGEIVDGYHRWSLVARESPLKDERVSTLTGGRVPVVRLLESDSRAEQIMATIRHNRARGEHYVRQMADIVRTLIDKEGLSPEEVGRYLGMEDEEVDRLYDHRGMTERGRGNGFSKGWVPE